MFRDIIGLYSTTVTYWPAKQSNSVKKRKIRLLRGSMSFKVIEVVINRKPVWDFLLVINSNGHFISCRFGVIAAYYSNFGHCVFEPPFRGLKTMYDVHLWLIGKRVLDFLLPVALIELFSLGVTAEALRAIIGSKSAISLQRGPVDPKFQVEGVAPRQPFFFSEN